MISTHIQGLGQALFTARENQIHFLSASDENEPVDAALIQKADLIVAGIAHEPYIHLDIRTPFGESVGQSQIDIALAEALGPRHANFQNCGWHIQFVEDTNLGSNHRVFVALKKNNDQSPKMGFDGQYPLELAIEAYGEKIFSEKGEANFQFLFKENDFAFSLLFLNGAPFHILNLSNRSLKNNVPDLPVKSDSEKNFKKDFEKRILQHREFAINQGKLGQVALKTFYQGKLELQDFPLLQDLKPSQLPPLEFSEANRGSDSIPRPLDAKGTLHYGLALVASQAQYQGHNQSIEEAKNSNYLLRTRFQFLKISSAIFGICLLILSGLFLSNLLLKNKINKLNASYQVFENQVKKIRDLRKEKIQIETSIAELSPVWNLPMNWSEVFNGLAKALPHEAGIDGISATLRPDGKLSLSFRAWVKDWNQVQGIEKSLSHTHPFSNIVLSEQRKESSSGTVVFQVTATLERD